MEMWMDVDTALAEVPVNLIALIDDTDFKTREEGVVFNQAGLDLVWNFVTTAGVFTQTAVVPTDTAGVHDWINQGNGMYSIEIPASAGTINNDTEGFGWFTGFATGILPWRGPVIGFRAAGLNDALVDNAHSVTRGLAGTALPAVAAEGAGGLYTRGTGAGQINQSANGKIDASGDWVIGIKKNTSTNDFLFKLRLSSDHVSPATGLTPVMTVSLDGGAFVAKNAGTTIAEIGSTGWYQVDANAADLNGDRIIWKFAVATADDSELVIFTVP